MIKNELPESPHSTALYLTALSRAEIEAGFAFAGCLVLGLALQTRRQVSSIPLDGAESKQTRESYPMQKLSPTKAKWSLIAAFLFCIALVLAGSLRLGYASNTTSTQEDFVRPMVIIPSDVSTLPSDEFLRSRVSAITSEVRDWLSSNTNDLDFSFADPIILHSTHNDMWFHTEPGGRFVSQSWAKVGQELSEQGYSGLCPQGFIHLVWVATEVEGQGGFGGGSRCGSPIISRPDWNPDTGPGNSGIASFGQWNLDTIISDGESATCVEESVFGPGICSRNHQMGTLVHELGHALGLNHPCEGWEAEHWNLSPEECNAAIMQNPGAYSFGGFVPQEVDILSVTSAHFRLKDNIYGFDDEFSSPTLDWKWRWIDPNSDSSYDYSSGKLRISLTTGGHDLYPGSNLAAPRMVQSIYGDFTAITQVSTDPRYVYQGAGLLAWWDDNSFVRLEREVSGVSMHWNNSGMYDGIPAVATSEITLYLRLVRSGNTFTGSFSVDGDSWTEIRPVESGFWSVPLVGLTAINHWQDNPYQADFYAFYIGTIPKRIFLPIALKSTN